MGERGLPVTVLGTADGPAIAIAGYGTPLELALGVVSAGVGESLADVVAELVDARERRERGG